MFDFETPSKHVAQSIRATDQTLTGVIVTNGGKQHQISKQPMGYSELEA